MKVHDIWLKLWKSIEYDPLLESTFIAILSYRHSPPWWWVQIIYGNRQPNISLRHYRSIKSVGSVVIQKPDWVSSHGRHWRHCCLKVRSMVASKRGFSPKHWNRIRSVPDATWDTFNSMRGWSLDTYITHHSWLSFWRVSHAYSRKDTPFRPGKRTVCSLVCASLVSA